MATFQTTKFRWPTRRPESPVADFSASNQSAQDMHQMSRVSNFPPELFPAEIIIPGKDEPETRIPVNFHHGNFRRQSFLVLKNSLYLYCNIVIM